MVSDRGRGRPRLLVDGRAHKLRVATGRQVRTSTKKDAPPPPLPPPTRMGKRDRGGRPTEGSARYREGRREGGPAGDASEDAFAAGQRVARCNSIRACDQLDLIDEVHADGVFRNLGDKVGCPALPPQPQPTERDYARVRAPLPTKRPRCAGCVCVGGGGGGGAKAGAGTVCLAPHWGTASAPWAGITRRMGEAVGVGPGWGAATRPRASPRKSRRPPWVAARRSSGWRRWQAPR